VPSHQAAVLSERRTYGTVMGVQATISVVSMVPLDQSAAPSKGYDSDAVSRKRLP
jgi:hypothetical protein